jgi:hypothetical protein
MSNDLTPREPDDDGFNGSLGLFRSNNYLRWTDTAGWTDRDGLAPPSPMLVLAVDEALQRWKDKKQELIREKPLPDIEQLNAAIPQSEWELGKDGKLHAWEHVVIVCLINPATGRSYRYTAATVGAHIAYDELREAVMGMRALRGANVFPVVNLGEKPWNTSFGLRKRPYFDIIDFQTPGGTAPAVPAKSAPPQLSAPVETPPTSSPPVTASKPTQPHQAKPKPPVNLASETLDAMDDVPPATTGEILNDEVPW